MSECSSANSTVDREERSSARVCRIGYGLLGVDLKHISEVPSGLACGCRCIDCGLVLIAKKGRNRAAHFAHHDASNCDGGLETLLHRLSKEIFGQLREMELPAYEFSRSSYVNLERVRYSGTVREARRVSFTRADIEIPLSGLIPDVVVWNGSHRLIVEIAVTHRVDQEKLDRIRTLGIPALEIRLCAADSLLTRAELMAKIESDRACKHWLFHPHLVRHERNFQERIENERRHQVRVQQLARRVQEVLFGVRRRLSKPTRRYGMTPGESLMDLEASIRRFYRHHEKYPSVDEVKEMLFGGGLTLRQRESK